MNNPHQNARTTVHSRELMVSRRAEGRPVAQIAAEFGVSSRTVWKWLRRYREGGSAALSNEASAPHLPGTAHAAHWRDVAAHLRRAYRMTGAEIAERLHLARSTVARWLRHAGIGRLASLEPREPVRRYQRDRQGELLHLDIKKLGRFTRTGHRITGDRRKQSNTRGVRCPAGDCAAICREGAGTSSTSPSMTRHDWPMSRSCRTSGAARLLRS